MFRGRSLAFWVIVYTSIVRLVVAYLSISLCIAREHMGKGRLSSQKYMFDVYMTA
jgi:hypothetical protein